MITSAARPRAPDHTTTKTRDRARTVPGWRRVRGRNLNLLTGRFDMFRKLSTVTAAVALLAAVGFSGTAWAQERVESGPEFGAFASPSAAALAAAITTGLTANSCLVSATLTEGTD